MHPNTLRDSMKKPDIKWKRDISDVDRLRNLQRELIQNAATLVKKGGVLVYSTCTTEPEENQDIVQAFLESHPDFSLEPADRYVSKDLVTPEGYIETFPHRHDMDGSFAARLVRNKT